MKQGMLWLGCVLAVLMLNPASADAQILKKLKEKTRERVEQATERQIDKGLDKLENAVKCAAGDDECIAQAHRDGKKVMVTDDEGNPLPAEEQPDLKEKPAPAPAKSPKLGEGAWSNFDFVPGERVLFTDDFSRDQVGNFPQRLELVQGNMEVVEWQGKRLLRASSDGTFAIALPEVLPPRFTIEFDSNIMYNFGVRLLSGDASLTEEVSWNTSADGSNLPCSYVVVNQDMVGLRKRLPTGDIQTAAAVRGDEIARDAEKELFRIRVHADNKYFKVYVNERRVANVPNFEFCRGSKIYVELNGAHEDDHLFIGNFTIAAGGRRMYDALMADGRIVTQGILFDTNSDRIRPESNGTLKEIAGMLSEHPELRIRIEGHTDDVGDDAANLSLSERRAASVRAYLTGAGIAASRLESAGLGETRPAGKNDTPEGRQNNRRVELVKL